MDTQRASTALPRPAQPPCQPSETTAVRHIDQRDLARRWSISPRTLERWRWTGEGPQFVKIGARVVYRLEDVERYERAQIRASTADKPSVTA